MFLERLISIEEVLSLISTLFLGEVSEDLSITVLLVGDMVGKENCCELDMIVELKVGGKLNLFAIFPIGTIMQDGGKRKRSNVSCASSLSKRKRKRKEKQNQYKIRKIKENKNC